MEVSLQGNVVRENFLNTSFFSNTYPHSEPNLRVSVSVTVFYGVDLLNEFALTVSVI